MRRSNDRARRGRILVVGRRCQYTGVAPGLHAVVLRRVPVWAIIPVFLLFPDGLIFHFVRESIRLDVSLFNDLDGAVLRLSVRTEAHILDRVRAAVAGLATV